MKISKLRKGFKCAHLIRNNIRTCPQRAMWQAKAAPQCSDVRLRAVCIPAVFQLSGLLLAAAAVLQLSGFHKAAAVVFPLSEFHESDAAVLQLSEFYVAAEAVFQLSTSSTWRAETFNQLAIKVCCRG